MSAPNIWELRGSVTYVTGAHAFKFGVGNSWGRQYLLERDINSATSYRFNNGVPNLITMRASPVSRYDDLKAELGLYVQDKWTMNRLTLSGGLRFDYFSTYFPETPLGPGPLVPNRNFVVPQYDWYNWKDISPRIAAVYDLFGNGKTALKANVGRYVAGRRQHGRQRVLDPRQHRDAVVERSRRAGHRRRLRAAVRPAQPAGQRRVRHRSPTCASARQVPSTAYDPDVLVGWGKRGYNWEFSTGVQHELTNRVGLDVSYFRRIYGNFTVTDNRAVAATDYSPLPASPRRSIRGCPTAAATR